MKPKVQMSATTIQGAKEAPQPQYFLNSTSMSLLEAFSDEPSRAILNSAISRCKSIEELAHENNIPVSTAYRRVHHLVDRGLLLVERIVITQEGKRYSLVRSTFEGARIEVQQNGVQVTCSPNRGVTDIAFRIWQLNNRDLEMTSMV